MINKIVLLNSTMLVFAFQITSPACDIIKKYLFPLFINSPYAIIVNARKHMKPELKQCENLQCIEKLLYQEEDEAKNQFLDEYAVPVDKRKEFDAAWDDFKTNKAKSVLMSDKQVQDEKAVGVGLVKKTRTYLEKSGVDPDSVKIMTDKEFFIKDKNAQAYASSSGSDVPATIIYDVEGINGAKINESYDYLIAHEVMHVAELHTLKEHAYKSHFKIELDTSNTYIDPSSIPSTYRAWNRMQEKQAELFPLLRFDDPNITKQAWNKYMPQCMREYKKKNLKWHTSPDLATHPTCPDILPYLVRINDIKNTAKKL